MDHYDARADAYALLEALGTSLEGIDVRPEAPLWHHPGRSATMGLGPMRPNLFIGEMHPRLLTQRGLEAPAVALEIRLGDVSHPRRRPRAPLQMSDYPAVERDLAFVVDRDLTATAVVDTTHSAERSLIESVRMFDAFEGGPWREEKVTCDSSAAATVQGHAKGDGD